MADELLTIKQIAKQLGVAPSTVKYWRDKFPEFMPTVEGGRYPQYRPEAIEIFKIIGDGISDNLQQRKIAEKLSAEFPINIEQTATDPAATTAATVQQQQSLYSPEMIKQDIESRQELTAAIRELTEMLKQMQRPRRSWWPWRKGKH
jgi:DNA-binding transcriptional MerR regulator